MTHNSLGKLLLLGMVAALSAAGCNANPVAASAGSQAAVGYKQDARANQAPQVDILWVIDNSGTMAEEQGSVIGNFGTFIKKVAEAQIDFHIGVTTTDVGEHSVQVASGWNTVTQAKGGLPGELRKVPTPEMATYAEFSSSYIAENTLAALLQTAYLCADKSDDTKMILDDILKAAGWKNQKARGGPRDKDGSFDHNRKLVGQVIGQVNDNLKKLKFTVPDVLKNKNYLARNDYQRVDGSLDLATLTKDFSCMALVGTSGYGLERGLRASLQAVERSKAGGKNEGFIRSTAKFGVIYITDENDCTLDYEGKGHSGTVKEVSCSGRLLCDYLLDPSIPEGENPLMSISSVKDKLLQALKDVKGVDVVDKDVVAGAVTGHSKSPKQNVFPPADAVGPFTADPSQFRNFLNQGKDFNVQGTFCDGMPGYSGTQQPKANEAISVCDSPAFGRSWSGSRYLQFINQFPNHYPSLDTSGKTDGLMCVGDFSGVFDALGTLFAGKTTCITNELYGCDEGKQEGDDCGPEELQGKCMKNVGDGRTDLYCSSAVRLVAYPKDEEQGTLLENSGFCIEGSQGTLPENARACILKSDLYEFVACPSPAKGMLFKLKDPKDIDAKLKGMPLDLEFTAHPPSDSDEEETPSTP